MTDEGYKRKLTAIFSADVVGYSRLMGENEADTVKTLTAYRKIITLAYMSIGKEDEARNHAAEVLKIDPTFSLEWVRQATFFKDKALLEEDLSALRKAGLK